MPGSRQFVGGGPAWRKRFRRHEAARYETSARPLPIFGCVQGAGYIAPWSLFNDSVGPVYGLRGYNTPAEGVPVIWPGQGTGPMPPGVPGPGQVISIKPNITQVLAGSLDTALTAYFALVPAGAFVTCWHEAEIAAQKLGYSQSQVIAMLTRCWGLFSNAAPASASFGQIASTYSAVFSGALGYPLGPWMCTPANGGAQLDFYGMDVYPATINDNFSANVGTTMAVMQAAGVPQSGPWTIPEAGAASSSQSIWHGTPSQWLNDGWNVAQQIGAVHFFVYFNNDLGETALYWPSQDPNTLQVVASIAAIARGDPIPAAAAAPARSTTAPLATSTSTTSLTATFSSNPVAGSKVLVAVEALNSAVITVADNGTTAGVFVQDSSVLNSNTNPSVYIYRADNVTLPASGTYAVTVTLGTAGQLQVAACAYTGVRNGPPSATSAILAAASSSPSLYPVIPSNLSSLFFEAIWTSSGLNPESITSPTPVFTIGVTQANGTSLFTGGVADAIVTSAAPLSGGFTLADAPASSAVMNAYSAIPATVSIVPTGTWAGSPDPGAGVTVNAGLASASAAALSLSPNVSAGLAAATATAATFDYVSAGLASATGTGEPAVAAPFVAGLASASGWAAVNAAGSGTNAPAGLASASAVALAPALGWTPALASATATALNGGIASNAASALASAAAPFSSSGGAVSLTLTQGNPVGATVFAGSPGVGYTPGLAVSTGNGESPVPQVSVTAGLASTAGAGLQPYISATGLAQAAGAGVTPVANVSGTPAAAAGSAAAFQPALGWTPGLASSTAAAQAPVPSLGLQAAPALANANGENATVTGSGSAPAGLASVTATGLSPYISAVGLPAGTAASLTATANVGPNAGLASSTAAELASSQANPLPASGSAAGKAPTPSISGTPAAALSTATAQTPALGWTPALAAASATAQGVAQVSVNAGLASAGGTVPAPYVSAVAPALASGAALNATISTGAVANAGLASASGAALGATAPIGFTTGLAVATGTVTSSVAQAGAAAALVTGTATALPAASGAQPAFATGTARVVTPSVSISVSAAAASGAALQPSAAQILKAIGTAMVSNLNQASVYSVIGPVGSAKVSNVNQGVSSAS
jgi:hypothetical protein